MNAAAEGSLGESFAGVADFEFAEVPTQEAKISSVAPKLLYRIPTHTS